MAGAGSLAGQMGNELTTSVISPQMGCVPFTSVRSSIY